MDAWKHNDAKIRERAREPRRAEDAAGDDRVPFRDSRARIAATCCRPGPPASRTAAFSTTTSGTATCCKIATAADFCGTRWQVNAVMIPVPHGKSYLMPVARVMKLYRHHIGQQAIAVQACPSDFDVVASRTDNKVFLHVVNTRQKDAVDVALNLGDAKIVAANSFEITDDPMVEVSDLNDRDVMQVNKRELARRRPLESSARQRFGD